MVEFLKRSSSPYPFQEWRIFPPDAIVQVKNQHGQSSIGQAKEFWWGYEKEGSESVIQQARRLDRPNRRYEW